MASDKIKLGLVGYGNSAKSFHLPFINATERYELVACLQRAEAPVDPSSAPKGSHCTVDYPNIKHHRTSDSFFADSSFEFVVVATHTDTHASFAKLALEAGKHVLADKPFARSAAEADEVMALAKAKNLIVTCYQNRRWDGDFLTTKHLINSGALGEVKEAEIHYDFEMPDWIHYLDAPTYTPGSGLCFGLGTHSLDHAFTLFGRPSLVTGFFRTQREVEYECPIEDSFTIILQYLKNGVEGTRSDLLVTVKTSVVTCMDKQLKYWVRGTKGSYIKHQQTSLCPSESAIAVGLLPSDPKFGVEDREMDGTLTTYEEFDGSVQNFDEKIKKWTGRYPSIQGQWKGLYENVADTIQGKAELEVKPEQSRDVIRCIELARQSSDFGKIMAWC